MNVGLGFNPAAFARQSQPTQAKVNQQVSTAGGAGALYAQDSVVRKSQRRNSLKAVGAKVKQRKVLDKAGITKVAGARKR